MSVVTDRTVFVSFSHFDLYLLTESNAWGLRLPLFINPRTSSNPFVGSFYRVLQTHLLTSSHCSLFFFGYFLGNY